MTSTPRLTILPGVPGHEGRVVDGNRIPYPESTPDFAKAARQAGFEVTFIEGRDDRVYLGMKALEDWLPIIEITRDLLLGVQGGLLVELLKTYLPREAQAREPLSPIPEEGELEVPTRAIAPRATSILHVDWRVIDGDRTHRFRVDGDARSVLLALEEFEQGLQDG